MAENLQRVNPVLPDLLDTKVWEEHRQSRHPRKQRGDRQTAEPSTGAEPEGDTGQAPVSGLIDVRV